MRSQIEEFASKIVEATHSNQSVIKGYEMIEKLYFSIVLESFNKCDVKIQHSFEINFKSTLNFEHD